ncbi:hypothetical protein GQ42DRAFT_161252, partial [Ramicandelaber brevisporus]
MSSRRNRNTIIGVFPGTPGVFTSQQHQHHQQTQQPTQRGTPSRHVNQRRSLASVFPPVPDLQGTLRRTPSVLGNSHQPQQQQIAAAIAHPAGQPVDTTMTKTSTIDTRPFDMEAQPVVSSLEVKADYRTEKIVPKGPLQSLEASSYGVAGGGSTETMASDDYERESAFSTASADTSTDPFFVATMTVIVKVMDNRACPVPLLATTADDITKVYNNVEPLEYQTLPPTRPNTSMDSPGATLSPVLQSVNGRSTTPMPSSGYDSRVAPISIGTVMRTPRRQSLMYDGMSTPISQLDSRLQRPSPSVTSFPALAAGNPSAAAGTAGTAAVPSPSPGSRATSPALMPPQEHLLSITSGTIGYQTPTHHIQQQQQHQQQQQQQQQQHTVRGCDACTHRKNAEKLDASRRPGAALSVTMKRVRSSRAGSIAGRSDASVSSESSITSASSSSLIGTTLTHSPDCFHHPDNLLISTLRNGQMPPPAFSLGGNPVSAVNSAESTEPDYYFNYSDAPNRMLQFIARKPGRYKIVLWFCRLAIGEHSDENSIDDTQSAAEQKPSTLRLTYIPKALKSTLQIRYPRADSADGHIGSKVMTDFRMEPRPAKVSLKVEHPVAPKDPLQFDAVREFSLDDVVEEDDNDLDNNGGSDILNSHGTHTGEIDKKSYDVAIFDFYGTSAVSVSCTPRHITAPTPLPSETAPFHLGDLSAATAVASRALSPLASTPDNTYNYIHPAPPAIPLTRGNTASSNTSSLASNGYLKRNPVIRSASELVVNSRSLVKIMASRIDMQQTVIIREISVIGDSADQVAMYFEPFSMYGGWRIESISADSSFIGWDEPNNANQDDNGDIVQSDSQCSARLLFTSSAANASNERTVDILLRRVLTDDEQASLRECTIDIPVTRWRELLEHAGSIEVINEAHPQTAVHEQTLVGLERSSEYEVNSDTGSTVAYTFDTPEYLLELKLVQNRPLEISALRPSCISHLSAECLVNDTHSSVNEVMVALSLKVELTGQSKSHLVMRRPSTLGESESTFRLVCMTVSGVSAPAWELPGGDVCIVYPKSSAAILLTTLDIVIQYSATATTHALPESDSKSLVVPLPSFGLPLSRTSLSTKADVGSNCSPPQADDSSKMALLLYDSDGSAVIQPIHHFSADDQQLSPFAQLAVLIPQHQPAAEPQLSEDAQPLNANSAVQSSPTQSTSKLAFNQLKIFMATILVLLVAVWTSGYSIQSRTPSKPVDNPWVNIQTTTVTSTATERELSYVTTTSTSVMTETATVTATVTETLLQTTTETSTTTLTVTPTPSLTPDSSGIMNDILGFFGPII